ncbi:MAG: hypothetical protein ACTSVI_13070 [Promethearchaeota archaeon]
MKTFLTSCAVWNLKKTLKDKIIPIPTEIEFDVGSEDQYVLGIYSKTRDFLKITTYILKVPDVTKIILTFKMIDSEIINTVSKKITEFNLNPIHSSGFCSKMDSYIYEMYINKSASNVDDFIKGLIDSGIEFDSFVEVVNLIK